MATLSPPATPLALVCPSCRSSLEERGAAYPCSACGRTWPVIAGVPRFVSSEQYVSSFGWQWRRHARTQIDRAEGGESERTFAAKTGLSPADVEGKRVLDVGVGAGRFAHVVGRWGGTPVGADLSLAVLSARKNLADFEGAFVAQADLFQLPFAPESFDVVYSIGVLHHTPCTRDAFRAIAKLVKPGGVLAVGVYETGEVHRWSDRYRRFTRELRPSLLHLLSHVAVPYYHVQKALRSLGSLGDEAADLLYWALPTRVHPDPQWRILDTFDWYSPWFQWKHDEAEVRGWFAELGFEDVTRPSDRTMLCVRGRRPLEGALREPPPAPAPADATLPGWVPRSGAARQATLLALLAAEVARGFGAAALGLFRSLVTRAVLSARMLLGSEVPR